MEIKVINRSTNELPAYATALSAGMDIRANLSESLILQPLERKLVPTGLFLEIPEGFEVQIRPRSGLAFKHGITVLNSPGTIDADYRGEVGVLLVNLSNEPFEIQHGERIAQMVVASYTQAELIETTELSATDRGSGGFGSTGKK
jgi:dUTP pyrophosphatase